MDNTRDRVQAHADIAKRLQDKLMEAYEKLLDGNAMTAQDRKNLQDLLIRNGWTFDPRELPKALRDQLGDLPKFDEDLDADNRMRVMP